MVLLNILFTKCKQKYIFALKTFLHQMHFCIATIVFVFLCKNKVAHFVEHFVVQKCIFAQQNVSKMLTRMMLTA